MIQAEWQNADGTPEAVEHTRWYDEGYAAGCRFALEEAEYDDIAAIARAEGIPAGWDLFRAEILNENLGAPGFDFSAYADGFSRACIDLFRKI